MAKRAKYETHILPYLDKIERWVEKGATNKDIAKNLGISYSTLRAWIKAGEEGEEKYAALTETFARARKVPNDEVENALFRRACGIEYDERTYETQWSDAENDYVEVCVKRVTKYIPPDPTSAMFWLTNMLPDKWQYHRQKADRKEDEDCETGVLLMPDAAPPEGEDAP